MKTRLEELYDQCMKTRLEELDLLTNEKLRELYDLISNCAGSNKDIVWKCMCEYVKIVIARHDEEKRVMQADL